ncbi:hypothetical protein PENSTE_c011G00770 [Penicillium steckii]|uniref:Uncharacterized protein n=1 Tax=Penicillium steckii TaxID=303698 RepID=A0A1V6T642_9EURO|nr:hypothetical protein PENSTE_c011G00770 [Penicillium steckii]
MAQSVYGSLYLFLTEGQSSKGLLGLSSFESSNCNPVPVLRLWYQGMQDHQYLLTSSNRTRAQVETKCRYKRMTCDERAQGRQKDLQKTNHILDPEEFGVESTVCAEAVEKRITSHNRTMKCMSVAHCHPRHKLGRAVQLRNVEHEHFAESRDRSNRSFFF